MILRSFRALCAVGLITLSSYSYAETQLACKDMAECQSKEAAITAQIEKLKHELAHVKASIMVLNSGVGDYLKPTSGSLGPVVRVGDRGTEKFCSGDKGDVCRMSQYEAEKYCKRTIYPRVLQT